ncbi:FirrV-1-B38 [Feldmannia irregularis virus a]|uniref:FirrV-1-B38 n=1 Tax=Feldmannia irregularis virus a TaxID=231992 RepID=Q6XLZ8_9PHYC|nr:FirrV-1-B38 [Feldmannia irregularis virus a]AAR26913.1 FirrV-1-B38 [Feldmannia irregularis virus a]
MSTAVVDLSQYGDTKGRNGFLQNIFQVTKGTGSEINELTHGFYGIPSTTSDEYEMARISVTEGSVDGGVGTFAVGVHDGSALNDIIVLNNASSDINTQTLNVNATDVFASGNLDVGIVQRNSAALGSRVELISDETEPAINFVLGDLADIENAASSPLIVTSSTVAVNGALTIDGTNVFEAITAGNPWTSTDAVTQLKSDYSSVEINVVNPYTTTVALDVNGSVRVRGNSLFFYDEPNTTFYSALSYLESDSTLRLAASKAGDSIVLATTSGSDNTYVDRLTFSDGSGTTNAVFENVNVGINATPSGTFSLEVGGNASFSTGLHSGGDADFSANSLVNVSAIQSSDQNTEQAQILLTSDSSSPKIDIVLGDLANTPTTVATFDESTASFATPAAFSGDVTIGGNLNVAGTQVILNTTVVEVQDINIEMGYAASAHSDIDGGGVILGAAVTGITVPSLLYSESNARWETSVDLNVPNLTVGTDTEITNSSVSLKSDSGELYFGANKQWRLSIVTDTDGSHFQVAHDDDGSQTYVTKMDVLA